ncbi:MAG TPA: hypothetical protein DCL54_10740 [Alphaproteobacteria bacterium]|nr:hypothetical protein [Alphaproteobacteria bacterium]HAJ47045.1 hypothetical protein [Alphaproteobacteria bacterium]
MTFLIDENLPAALVEWFAGQGVNSKHLSEVGLLGQSDRAIAEYAIQQALIVLTKDKDFDHLVVANSGLRVVRLQIGNMRTRDLFAWLERKLYDLERAAA